VEKPGRPSPASSAAVKAETLSRGPLGPRALHICVDMQVMFAEATPWHMPWLRRVLPAVIALVERDPSRTMFTRFVPAARPGEGVGMWRDYYLRWSSMTLEQLGSPMVSLIPELAIYTPPARIFDKFVYSPWTGTDLAQRLQGEGVDTILVSGGETDVCVLATVLGAVDWGFRVVVATDAICSSADETHDAMMTIYHSRFAEQVETATVDDILRGWE
jgi:nicotinamidase-related amidase